MLKINWTKPEGRSHHNGLYSSGAVKGRGETPAD
jgi:hypothetical protein